MRKRKIGIIPLRIRLIFESEYSVLRKCNCGVKNTIVPIHADLITTQSNFYYTIRYSAISQPALQIPLKVTYLEGTIVNETRSPHLVTVAPA